jgi:sulfatase modifying factor 1
VHLTRLVAWCALAAGCGRIGFDGSSGRNGDGGAGDDAMDAALAMTCGGLAPICGPQGTSPCCGSHVVPGGTFFRGYDVGTDAMFPTKANAATVSSFSLDTYEVTVGRFRAFIEAGKGAQSDPPALGAGARTLNGMADQAGWTAAWTTSLETDTTKLRIALQCDADTQTWTDTPGANEALPINCITWFEAFAFCVWDGGFLPTEAEANYAAAGGDEQRAFPWSAPASAIAIDCTYANYAGAGGHCVAGPSGNANRVGSESPKGDGRWGHADLGGNLWEWLLDWSTAYQNPCVDCAALVPGSQRMFKGGSYFDVPKDLRGAARNSVPPTSRYSDFGFRCARPAM